MRARFLINICVVLIGTSALAAIGTKNDPADVLAAKVRQALSKKYPGTRVELTSGFHWIRGGLPNEITGLEIVSESQRGEAQFVVRSGTRAGSVVSEGWVTFSAWLPTWVALRRILPGERLHPDMFVAQEVSVASGMAREYRGLILPQETVLSGYEASQTILEGQYPLSAGIRKVPDIRRGEPLQIRLVSGGVSLSTPGVAEEPAYIDRPVRVMTVKTKKLLTGKLLADGVVEVKL